MKKKVLQKTPLLEKLLHSGSYKTLGPICNIRKREKAFKEKSTKVTHGLINSKEPAN